MASSEPPSSPIPPAASSPSQPPSTSQALRPRPQDSKILFNISLLSIVACPVLVALPPRKLDFYTFSLAAAFALSLNNVVQSNHPVPLLGRVPNVGGLPTDKAREMQEKLRRQKEARGAAGAGEKKGALEKIWMGDEKAGWKERRLAEEQRRLNSGETYGNLIIDQIKEVWGVNKDKDGDETREDEKKG